MLVSIDIWLGAVAFLSFERDRKRCFSPEAVKVVTSSGPAGY